MKRIVKTFAIGSLLTGVLALEIGFTDPPVVSADQDEVEFIAKRTGRPVLEVQIDQAKGAAAELHGFVKMHSYHDESFGFEAFEEEIVAIQNRILQIRRDKPSLPIIRREKVDLQSDLEQLEQTLPNVGSIQNSYDRLVDKIKNLG